jgi:hypothetical protein
MVILFTLIIVISLSLTSLSPVLASENLHITIAAATVYTYSHPSLTALASIPPFFMFPQQEMHRPTILPHQGANQGTMSKGTINSVIKTPTAEWIASGNWTLNLNNQNKTYFKVDMTWFNNNGKTSHTHQFQNFRSVATNTTGGGNVTTVVQPGNNVNLNGVMDVGTNHRIVWKNVPSTIRINGAKTITISVDDNATNHHFAGQPILGLVTSFTRVSK